MQEGLRNLDYANVGKRKRNAKGVFQTGVNIRIHLKLPRHFSLCIQQLKAGPSSFLVAFDASSDPKQIIHASPTAVVLIPQADLAIDSSTNLFAARFEQVSGGRRSYQAIVFKLEN